MLRPCRTSTRPRPSTIHWPCVPARDPCFASAGAGVATSPTRTARTAISARTPRPTTLPIPRYPPLVSTSALVRRFYDDLWNRWDDALVPSVLSPDFSFRGSLGTSTHGLAEWRAYRDTVRAGSSDFHNAVVDLVVDGPSAAARL